MRERHNLLKEQSDIELLRHCAAEPAAFGVFYDRHIRAVLAFLYARTVSAEFAADLAAETFAQAYLSRRKFRDAGASARPWLIGIARRKLSHALRSQRAASRALRKLGVETPAFDDASLERIEAIVDLAPLRQALHEALESLSPAVSRAIVLRIGEDLPYQEVARRLGCTEGAARVRVARGLEALGESLGGT